jgi:uncharacterized protein
MHLKNTALLVASFALCMSLATAAPAPSKASDAKPADEKTALAMQVIEITKFDRLVESMRSQVVASIEQSVGAANQCAAAEPEVDAFAKALSDKLVETLSSSDFKVDVAAIYAETFDESELRGIIAFYKSPLGKKLLARMPELTQKSMQVSQDRIRAIMPDLQKISADYEPRIAEASKACAVPGAGDASPPVGH